MMFTATLKQGRLLYKMKERFYFMAVSLKNIDYTSGCATFFYDDWATDGDKLPRIGIAGKDNLNTVKGCSQGSFAIGTDGGVKILQGENNEWIDY